MVTFSGLSTSLLARHFTQYIEAIIFHPLSLRSRGSRTIIIKNNYGTRPPLDIIVTFVTSPYFPLLLGEGSRVRSTGITF
jgi:hypothetical protein